MPSIVGPTTTFEFISLRGQGQTMGQTVEIIDRPGVDGQAYRQIGLRGRIYHLIGIVDVDSNEEGIDAYVDMVQDCQGQILPGVFDDYGGEADNVMCLEVNKVDQRAVAGGTPVIGTDPASLLYVQFILQNTEVP